MKSINRIFLLGFSGSGKSTVGEALARELKCRFFDTDRIISKKTRMSIPQVFDRHGERYFRRLESDAIQQLIHKGPDKMVVAVGGGAFQNAGNRGLIRRSGVTVYLSCSQRELYRRTRNMTDRPMLITDGKPGAEALKKKIAKLMRSRRGYYMLADINVSTTSRTISQTVRELTKRIRRLNENYKG